MKRTILSLLLMLALVLSWIPAGIRAEALPIQTEPRTEVPTQETEETPETTIPTEPEETIPETTEQQSPEQTEPESSIPESTEPEEIFPEETESETLPVTVEVQREPVEVFFTVTVEGYILPLEDRELLVAAQKLEVPDFDLTPYGLMGKTEGPTLAHLLIYATEVLYCGLDEPNAGQGYLAETGLLDTDVLTLKEMPETFWGLDGQLLCFVDGMLWDEQEVPDCTAISLEEDSNILLAVLPQEVTATAGYLSWEEGIVTAEAGREVFYAPVEEIMALGGDVTDWYSAGITDEGGQLHWDAPAPGEYCLAIPAIWEEETVCLSAVVSFLAEEETAPAELPRISGDVNGDGVLDPTDGASLAGYVNGTVELSEAALALADMDGDGKINMLDVALIYRSLSAEQ